MSTNDDYYGLHDKSQVSRIERARCIEFLEAAVGLQASTTHVHFPFRVRCFECGSGVASMVQMSDEEARQLRLRCPACSQRVAPDLRYETDVTQSVSN